MELERVTMCSAAKPKLRKQRQLLSALNKEYEQLMLDIKVKTFKKTCTFKKIYKY